MPLAFAPYLAGASLFALDKTKNGIFDVRPIASGEILRRLVGKCLCMTRKEPTSKFLGLLVLKKNELVKFSRQQDGFPK